jgi:DNA repair exonuclease SbcCD nuclease subunit
MVVRILRHQPFTAFALGHLHQSLGRKQRHPYQRYRPDAALVLSIRECIFTNPNVRNRVIKNTILNTGVHRFRQSQARIQLDQPNELVGLKRVINFCLTASNKSWLITGIGLRSSSPEIFSARNGLSLSMSRHLNATLSMAFKIAVCFRTVTGFKPKLSKWSRKMHA